MLQEWYSSPPCGCRRHLDPLWSHHVQQYFWPNGDNDWFEYAEWVEQGGGDDEFMSSPSSCVQDGFMMDADSQESSLDGTT